MDEYSSGMDPQVKRYFRKIINSFSVGLMWLLSVATAGLFFDLGIAREGLQWYNIVFYAIALSTFIALVFYLYRVWTDREEKETIDPLP